MLNFIPTRKINRDLPIPYYYQIVQILREAIQDHEVDPEQGDPLFPSEMELAEFFQVNRGTIRHALETLEREGLIYREKGRGTFLQRRRVELDLAQLCSTTEDLKARGWSPASRLLGLSSITPGLHIQRFLNLREAETVWQIYRLRLANDEPISLQWSYIPRRLAPDLDKKDLNGSLYYILKNEYGIEMSSADQTIRARQATPEEAQLLGISENEILFEISRVTYDRENRPVEHLDSLWRGDRYDFHVRLYSSRVEASY
jgi:GntR family transcriptional regulator